MDHLNYSQEKRLMKKFLAVAGGFVLLIAAIRLFHLGPPGIESGEDRILDSLTLKNGDRLYLVAHRTGHITDAYEVDLFRFDTNGNAFVSWLAFEDGYWWRTSLNAPAPQDKVTINVYGNPWGIYSSSDGSITLTSDEKRKISSFRIDGVKITEPIPEAVLSIEKRMENHWKK